MSRAEDDPKLVFIEFDKATTPPAGLINHVKNHWWAVHPTKGLVFFKPDKKWPHPGTPQANSNEAISRQFVEKSYPWAECKFIPSVFYSIKAQDWV